jgi:hypothetical protein
MHVDTSAAEAVLRDYAEAFARPAIDRVVSFLTCHASTSDCRP